MPRLTAPSGARRDEGVVALVVTLFFGSLVFVTLLALVIDLGVARLERRQLQNGAEAASVRAAQDCALDGTTGHTCGSLTPLISIASLNSAHGSETVTATGLCGLGAANLAACGPGTLQNCPTTPTQAHWAQVTTSTWWSGSPFVPQFFSQSLIGPRTITACAQAAWGPPSELLATAPFAIGLSCWQAQSSGGGYPANPPYTLATEPTASEVALVLGTDSQAAHSCAVTAAGSGGFGWLDPTSSTTDPCELDLSYGQISQSTGASLSDAACQAKMAAMVNATEVSNNKWTPAYFNRVTYLPLYDTSTTASGTNASYHITGFAAFYMTGFQAPSLGKSAAPRVAANACNSSSVCIYGWFVQGSLIGASSQIGTSTQTNYGLSVVSPVG